ncbi:sugar transferase [Marinicaulis aureus]|uniref:Sugar transferase n=1 Tax=Hyphococcus aureus TaxID=2666033 RepID=A0ABW1KZ05_9PROT
MTHPLDKAHAPGATASATQIKTRSIGPLTRVFDIVFAVAAIVFFAPLMVFIAIAVAMSSPGPVIFAHSRVGQNGKLFPCLKFRTMVVNADEELQRVLKSSAAARAEWETDHKLKNDPRITPIGKWLRKFSLDELPQLFNILIGQMSVVGPRPIVIDEIKKYGKFFDDYCSVRPGLTGLWQVSGRNDISYDARVQLDVSYARNRTLLLDMKIVLQTVPAVIAFRGSY